jgi:hypothetical protein
LGIFSQRFQIYHRLMKSKAENVVNTILTLYSAQILNKKKSTLTERLEIFFEKIFTANEIVRKINF